jgi:hypothetical protein
MVTGFFASIEHPSFLYKIEKALGRIAKRATGHGHGKNKTDDPFCLGPFGSEQNPTILLTLRYAVLRENDG